MADPTTPGTAVIDPAADKANAQATAASSSQLLTIPQFAAEVKKRKPEFKDTPDDVLVREILKRQPQWMSNIQTSEPRRKPIRDREPTADQRTQKFLENHPLIREGALALAGGSGIPESKQPVSDIGKGLWQTLSDPPQTPDEKAVAPFITLPAYRIAKGVIQQSYGYTQEMFNAIDWKEMAKHPSSFDVFKAAKEPALMPDPNDPKKTIANPKAGQSIPGTGKEAQFVHGLVGLSTVMVTMLKGGKKAAEVPAAVEGAAQTATKGAQHIAGTGTVLAEKTAEQAVKDTAAENAKAAEQHAGAVEKHAAVAEKVTDQNAATEEAFRTKVERINQDFGEKVAKAREEHANDVKTRDQKISELQQQHVDAVKQARKEWVEKAHAAKKGEATKQSVENRKEVLQRTQRAYVDRIKDNVAQTFKTVKGKLDARYEKMRKQPAAIKDEDTGEIRKVKVEELPLNSVMLKESVDKGRKTLQGAPADLKVFNDLVRQMEQGDGSKMDAAEGSEPMLRPLTWDEGRTHFTALGDKLYSGELPGNVAKAIKEVRTAMDGELESAMVKGVTEKEGQGAGAAAKREYGQLKKDWSQFEDDWRDVGSEGKGASPLAKLRLAVDRGVIAANVLSKNFGDRLIETLARYKDSGANPALLDETRHYNKEAQSGSVRVSHFPGEVESVSTKGSAPKAPGKLELPEAPKEPAPVASADPKVAEIEAERAKRVERATQDKPEPKPVPPAPEPPAKQPLPSTEEMVKKLQQAKDERFKKVKEGAQSVSRHDVALTLISVFGAFGSHHIAYAFPYVIARFGEAGLMSTGLARDMLTRVTPADIAKMNEVLSKSPELRAETTKAVTDALIEKAKKGEKIPPPSMFSKLLDKAQIGAILRVIAPPQQQPSPQPAVQP